MTGAWKTRKTNGRFSIVFPSPWKSLRDSHISTAPARRGKVENRKQVSHFPTCGLDIKTNSERRSSGGSLHSRLQAHCSMRKC